MHQEGAVGDVHHRDVRHVAQTLHHRLAVGLVRGLEGDVARHLPGRHLHHVDGADVAAGLADGGGDPAEHAGLVGETDADGQAVAGDGRVPAHDGLLAGLSGRPRIFPSTPFAQDTARGRRACGRFDDQAPRKAVTARAVASGCSSCGACPAPATISRRLWGRRRANSSA